MATRVSQVLAGKEAVGNRITIEGWIRTRRDSKAGLSFLAVHDGSCHDPLQVVAPQELANYQTDVLRLTSGCAVRVTGELVASQGKGQTVELRGEAVEVVGWVDDPDHYPMQPKRHTMEYLREVGHLRVRTNVIGAVTRVRHTLAQAVHRFFHERGFLWIHTPIITASDAEGAGQMFRVSTFERMDYTDAIKTLEKSGEKFEFPVSWGIDLQSEHERYLTEKVIKGPVAVINYPKSIKAFYMRQNDDGKTVAAMDVLAPGIGEIIGGSQREERLDVLDARLDELGLPREHYGWYRDLRRYGTVPHAGFGLGFERTILYATGMANVRDVIPFPRTPKNAEF